MVDRSGDIALLNALAQTGADLSRPAHTIHYLYFRSMKDAKSAAGELETAGYQNLRTHRTPVRSFWKRIFGPRTYSCIAETYAVPARTSVFETSDWMNALAEKLGGEYDGWEASVER